MRWRDLQPGAVRAAKVTHHYIDETSGLPVCDVADGYGNQYFGCRMMDMGGGDVDSFDYSPPPVHNVSNAHNTETYDDTGDVLISFGDGRNPKPVVLGTIYSAKRQESITAEEQDNGDSVDYGDIQNFEDRTIKHKKLRMVFAKTGTWLLDAKATKKPIRFQLDKKAFVRVSQDGAANEFVLLGSKMLDHVKSIHERIDELATRIDAVEAHAATIGSNLGALCTALGGLGAAMTAAGAAPGADVDVLKTGLSPTGVIPTFVDSPITPGVSVSNPWTFEKTSSTPDADRDKLKAGCFRISETSVFDQEGEEP